MPEAAAVVLFSGVVLYATFGGADFGAGFWDLLAGGAARGRRPRALIDSVMGPVWEANHVWLIFCLVVLWTAFPGAFAAIMTTLHIPLGLAALGIVLRGSGFAFRKVLVRTDEQRVAGAAFAASSVVTPFFLGTVAGGIASGRVPASGRGDPVESWLNPTGILGGTLAVLVCAYLAAVFLVAESRSRGLVDLERWFRTRAVVAAVATGAVAAIGIPVLEADAHHLFVRLIGRAAPLVATSGLCGIAALVAVVTGRGTRRALRGFASLAVATVIAGWGVAQYPDLLGTHLTIAEAAAPTPTLQSVLGVFAAALVVCGPSLALLYALHQRGRLEETAPSPH